MANHKIIEASIDSLIPDNKNFNKGTEFGEHLMDKSLREFGLGRSILIDKNNRIIAGNKTCEKAADLGFDNVIIVETDGKSLVAVKRKDIDLDSAKGRELALADNATGKANLSFDMEMLVSEAETFDFNPGDWGVETWRTEHESAKAQEDDNDDMPEDPAAMPEDRIYESDNEFDIPLLRLDRQPANGLLLPFAGWGTDTRMKKGISTYHFYVEDYRFTNIWKAPEKVLQSGCLEFVEPNLSLFDTTPAAYGLQMIYMKRWIARFWQECGARVYADLNVAKKFYKYNRMGIPDGYNAFATRGYAEREEYLKQEIGIARQISGLDKPNMIVYGGGDRIREICIQNNLLYLEPFMPNRKQKKGGE